MTEQLPLFESTPPPPQLPPLPSIIRYYDDFDRVDRRLESPHSNTWHVHQDGRVERFEFADIPEPVRSVVKRVLSETLVGNATTTAANYWRCWVAEPTDCLYEGVSNALQQSPLEFRSWWTMQAVEKLSRGQALAFRHLLHWLCRWEVGQWRSADSTLIRGLWGGSAGDCAVPSRGHAMDTAERGPERAVRQEAQLLRDLRDRTAALS